MNKLLKRILLFLKKKNRKAVINDKHYNGILDNYDYEKETGRSRWTFTGKTMTHSSHYRSWKQDQLSKNKL